MPSRSSSPPRLAQTGLSPGPRGHSRHRCLKRVRSPPRRSRRNKHHRRSHPPLPHLGSVVVEEGWSRWWRRDPDSRARTHALCGHHAEVNRALAGPPLLAEVTCRRYIDCRTVAVNCSCELAGPDENEERSALVYEIFTFTEGNLPKIQVHPRLWKYCYTSTGFTNLYCRISTLCITL